MSMTAEEILENEWNKNKNTCPFNEIYVGEKIAMHKAMIEFAKYHVTEFAKAICNGTLDDITTWDGNPYTGEGSESLDHDKVRAVYPVSKIE